MIDLPASLPVAVARCVRLAATVVDARGEVPGGVATLRKLWHCGDDVAARTALRACVARGVMRWVPGNPRHGGRVFVVVKQINLSVCSEGCGEPSKGGPCRACKQVLRTDLNWRHQAVSLAVNGMAPSAIAVRLNRDLWPNDDVDATVEDNGVAWALVQAGVLSEEWRLALVERRPDLAKRLTERARDRRRRRKQA